jgi:hypothetical protein
MRLNLVGRRCVGDASWEFEWGIKKPCSPLVPLVQHQVVKLRFLCDNPFKINLFKISFAPSAG